MKQNKLILIVLVGFALTSFSFLQAQITQFGGPNRDGVFNETALLNSWPEGGPELVATISGIGNGYASPSVTENGIYVAGMLDTIGYVFHFDNNYKLKWKTEIGPEFNYKYLGSRGTPTIEGNRLYYAASMGDAVCLNIETGEKIWNFNVLDKFNGPKVKWGYTESPLIYGEKIFFTPGGPGANFVALDKMTGELIWAADIDSTGNSYCSPVLINHNNKDMVLLNSIWGILLIDPDDGKVIVNHPLTANHMNHALAPIYNKGRLFFSSGYGDGSTLFQIVDGKTEMDTIYFNPDLDCKISGMINYKGIVYGTSDKRKMWVGVDYETGETVFTSRDFKAGSFVMADDKFFLYSDIGEVGLAIPSEKGFEVVSRFQIPAGRASLTFNHPVIHDGILYIRFNNDMWLYRIK